MENSRDVSVGDLIYGSDAYYGQVTRVGGSVVEFTTVGLMPAGPKGDQGDQGPIGPEGPQGPKGEPGEVQIKDMPGANLVMPDLTGKEHLGDGNYVLFQGVGSNIVTYNVNTGVYYYKNDGNSNILINIISDLSNILTPLTEYTFAYKIISGSINTAWRPFVTIGDMDISNIHARPTFQINDISPYNYLRLNWGSAIGDYEFTIQIEKGSTATPYTVPGQIPQYNDQFALKQQEGWITPTLLNGATSTDLAYRKNSIGQLEIKGRIIVTSSQRFMDLPTGYRPSTPKVIPVRSNVPANTDMGSFYINSVGHCSIATGESTRMLDNIIPL